MQAHQVAVWAVLVAVVPDAHPVEQEFDVGGVEAKAFRLLNEPDHLHRLCGVHAVAGRRLAGAGSKPRRSKYLTCPIRTDRPVSA